MSQSKSKEDNIHNKLTEIINKDSSKPKIVNKESNFVVVTYWWGRGVLNRNTARPCGAFYEDNLKKLNNIIFKLLATGITKSKSEGDKRDAEKIIENIFENLEERPEIFSTLMEHIDRMIRQYMNGIYDYKNVDPKEMNRFEKLKKDNPDFLKELKDPEELKGPIIKIIVEGIIKNKENLLKLYKLDLEYNNVKSEYLKYKDKKELTSRPVRHTTAIPLKNRFSILGQDINEEELRELVKDESPKIKELTLKVRDLKIKKDDLNKDIISVLKSKEEQKDGKKLSIFDKLIELLEYKAPIKFETMIEDWEKECEKHKCNHLAIEYPEFAKPGGYQLAINAKPKFIARALSLCDGRAVLYIDGDMTVRQYPAIFDMKTVDFMARGWWIDPRSSYKMSESIMYDPYNFETSGGIMFFSQSDASKKLINLWVKAAESPINEGKADDRVLSLIFNTKAVLTWLRLIQLPIEYLWLTLDYDERMLEEVYDYNVKEMESTIMIDHPECLTSEDTAAGAGASSNRQPKFYDFLEDLYPCVETTHEYITFKELVDKYPKTAENISEYMKLTDKEKETRLEKYKSKMVELNSKIIKETDKKTVTKYKKDREDIKREQTKYRYLPYMFWYYHYMGGVHYIDDGNPELIDLGYVEPGEPLEDNSQPLTIISYVDKFGNNKHPEGEGASYNKIVDINVDAAEELDLKKNKELYTINEKKESKYFEIIPTKSDVLNNKNLLRTILKLLLDKQTVIYNPTTLEGYDKSLYDKLVSNLDTIYKDIDFAFHPDHKKIRNERSFFYKPFIDMHQVILFRPEQRLIDFISMQLSLESLSIFISEGSYQFMSLVRVAFIFKSKIRKHTKTGSHKGGTKFDFDDMEREYIEAFESKVPRVLVSHKRRTIKKKSSSTTRTTKKGKKSSNKE